MGLPYVWWKMRHCPLTHGNQGKQCSFPEYLPCWQVISYTTVFSDKKIQGGGGKRGQVIALWLENGQQTYLFVSREVVEHRVLGICDIDRYTRDFKIHCFRHFPCHYKMVTAGRQVASAALNVEDYKT